MAAALAELSPAERSTTVGVDNTWSGVTSPSSTSTSRPWMACAARPASCWWTMARTSTSKRAPRARPGPGRRWTVTRFASPAMTGSRPDSVSTANVIAASPGPSGSRAYGPFATGGA